MVEVDGVLSFVRGIFPSALVPIVWLSVAVEYLWIAYGCSQSHPHRAFEVAGADPGINSISFESKVERFRARSMKIPRHHHQHRQQHVATQTAALCS